MWTLTPDQHKKLKEKNYTDISKEFKISVLSREYPEVNLTSFKRSILEEAIIYEVTKG